MFPAIFQARAFLLAAGFSLAFGAMFTKTYRVHQIISRANTGLVKSKVISWNSVKSNKVHLGFSFCTNAVANFIIINNT